MVALLAEDSPGNNGNEGTYTNQGNHGNEDGLGIPHPVI
jgi:hypothetical protein